MERTAAQLKHHLGSDGPLSQSDQLTLANHPLRIEAGPVTNQEPLRKRKLLQARELADHIARRILEAGPRSRAIVVGRQPRHRPGVHDGGRKGTLSDPPVRGNALARGCGPSKSTIHTSQTSTWHTQTEVPLLHPDIANQLQFAISKQACQPQVAESNARRGRLPDGSRGSTTGRGCSPSVEANHASHNGYYLPYCSNY